ncbi:Fc.00g002130.m01.CDS01 [Cosmosporella sp. VM-42]
MPPGKTFQDEGTKFERPSQLEVLEQQMNVDVDDVSTSLITSLPFMPHNQTSNQAVITSELLKPCNKRLLREQILKHGKDGWEKVYDGTAVAFCARNMYCLSGRLMVQVSLRHANDRDAIIKQARGLADLFAEAKIPRRRFAIKLPFTGSAASAAVVLNKEGIRTLATTVFSLEQAIAASQSNCLFISPYYNEIAAHLDRSTWTDFADPALEHPMSARVVHILETYAKAYQETGKEQPVMIIASHLNTKEVLAMQRLGCHHVTIQEANLKSLMATPAPFATKKSVKQKHPYAEWKIAPGIEGLSKVDPLLGPNWDGVKASMDTDYVSNGGKKLDEFLQKDPVVSKRFRDAERFFLNAENVAKEAILKEIETVRAEQG